MRPSSSRSLTHIRPSLSSTQKERISSCRRFYASQTKPVNGPSRSSEPDGATTSTREVAIVWDNDRRSVVTATSAALFKSRTMLQSLIYLLRSFLTSPLHPGYTRLKHGNSASTIIAGFSTGNTKRKQHRYPKEPLMWSLRKAQSRRMNTFCRSMVR